MSWYSKVVWSEGLFLRGHHLQQNDRYHEHYTQQRTALTTPYPWGFSHIEIDRDLALQNKFSVRRAAGVMPDGTPFDVPNDSPLPPAIELPENASGQFIWLTMPEVATNTREVDDPEADSASRFVSGTEMMIDATSELRIEEEVDVAYPRLAYEIRKTSKPGFQGMAITKVVEVRDKAVVFDEQFAPSMLICSAHPVVQGWIERAIGWIENRLDELARFAADPGAGGGLQSADYLMLQLLNRHLPVLMHFQRSRFVHPERLYELFISLSGELATFATSERRAPEYPAYNHDRLGDSFNPVIRDLQAFLSARLDRRAIRLEITERAPNAFVSTIRDRSLFRSATFVLEVSARRKLTDIQTQFPNLFKVGPNTKMNEIVHAHLPGVPLVHLPMPPPQIRAVADHVYFYFDRASPLWPEFATAASIGMHFSGDWPELELDLWAIRDDHR